MGTRTVKKEGSLVSQEGSSGHSLLPQTTSAPSLTTERFLLPNLPDKSVARQDFFFPIILEN